MKAIGALLAVVAVGLVMAVGLFYMTAPEVNPCCSAVGETVTDFGGTDPWTGDVRFRTYSVVNHTSSLATSRVEQRQHGPVIPLPVGFVIGFILVLGIRAAPGVLPKRLRLDICIAHSLGP